jgi:hypothetical protein
MVVVVMTLGHTDVPVGAMGAGWADHLRGRPGP